MFEILFFLVGLIAVGGVINYFWRFGNHGEWRDLVNLYKDPSPINKSYFESEVIYVQVNDSWIQWSYCSITFDSEGLHITQPKIINYLVPSIYIPYVDMKVGELIKPWFREYLPLSFKQVKTQLALSAKHQNELASLMLKCTTQAK